MRATSRGTSNPVQEAYAWAMERMPEDHPYGNLMNVLFNIIEIAVEVKERPDVGAYTFNQASDLIAARSRLLEETNYETYKLHRPQDGGVNDDGTVDHQLLGLSLLDFLDAVLILDLRKLSLSWANIAPLVGLSSAGAHRKYAPIVDVWLGGTDSLLP